LETETGHPDALFTVWKNKDCFSGSFKVWEKPLVGIFEIKAIVLAKILTFVTPKSGFFASKRISFVAKESVFVSKKGFFSTM
jgi:hypothetical protein